MIRNLRPEFCFGVEKTENLPCVTLIIKGRLALIKLSNVYT